MKLIRSISTGLLLVLLAFPAVAATTAVSTSAQVQTALTAAKPGDIIQLGGASYGALNLSKRQGLTIIAAAGAHPQFDSIALVNCQDIHFGAGITVALPYVDGSTTTNSQAVRVYASKGISFDGMTVRGPIVPDGAKNAAAAGATVLPSSGNAVGYPTGTGIWIGQGSSDVAVTNSDISQAMRAIVLSAVSDITVRGNDIHGIRAGEIGGNVIANVLVAENHLFDATSWNWGKGDHADYIHLWTKAANQTADTTGVVIRDNFMDQGTGVAILGIYLDTNSEPYGFAGPVIEGNVIRLNNTQAMRLENSTSVTNTGNQLFAADPPPADDRDQPRITMVGKYSGATSGNRASAITWVPTIATDKPASFAADMAKLNTLGLTVAGEANAPIAAWMAKFRAPPASLPTSFDAKAAIAELQAQLDAIKVKLGMAQ